MRKIATKIAKKLKKINAEKIINLSEYREAKRDFLDEWSQLNDTQTLIEKGHDPQHAVYIAAQNFISLLIEILNQFDALDRHQGIVYQAEKEYMPSWPPNSPISRSHFFSWLCFDVHVGLDKESYATCLLDLHKPLRLTEEYCHLLRLMESSRLGIYRVLSHIDGVILLQELFDQKQYRCVTSNQHPFAAGELLLTRLLPPISTTFDTYVMFVSPYILLFPEGDWRAFLARNVDNTNKAANREKAYQRLMKKGLSNKYWLEFIMQAYSKHTDFAIFLYGLPDIGHSRPHFYDNQILPES